MTKNDLAWNQLFDKFSILDRINRDSYFEITSGEINQVREARLMTKFDQKANLPALFTENNLSILPITRGSYVIGKFNAYENVYYRNVENRTFHIPPYIESIDTNNLYSEASALHTVHIGGVINDILGEEAMHTVSGRMSTGAFDYGISLGNGTFNISVNNSQCEIDGGYESQNKLILVEAKNFRVDDFLIRQMYYPYRLWSERINKEVIPAFFTYSNDIFSFFIYRFNNRNMYNSLELVRQINYTIEEEPITLDNIFQILQDSTIDEEPVIPFPQANNIIRTLDLLGLLMENELTTDEITMNYNFEQRQTGYYTNSARYLGLVDKRTENREAIYFLTTFGREIMAKRHKEKMLSIVGLILKHSVFNRSLRLYFNTLQPITTGDIAEIMNDSYIYGVDSQSTIERRASTVLSWILWILGLQE